MMNPRLFRPLCSLLAVALCASACSGGSVYELPPPPPESEQRDVSLVPGEDDRQSERDYVQARAAIIKLNSLLQSRRYEEALGMMSQETQTMLSYLSPRSDSDKPALATLVEGRIVLEGNERKVDSAAMLLAGDLSKLSDSLQGTEEQETLRRKEIFALQPDGSAKKIVMIKEGGQWVLHRTSIKRK